MRFLHCSGRVMTFWILWGVTSTERPLTGCFRPGLLTANQRTCFLAVFWTTMPPTKSLFIRTREYWMICRCPGCLAAMWFGSSPNPNLVSTRLAYWQWRGGGRGEGMGKEPNHTTGRKPSPLEIIQIVSDSDWLWIQPDWALELLG